MDTLDRSYKVLQHATARIAGLKHDTNQDKEAHEIREILEEMLRELPEPARPHHHRHRSDESQAGGCVVADADTRTFGYHPEKAHHEPSRLFQALADVLPQALSQRIKALCEAFREAARAEAEEIVQKSWAKRG